MKGIILSGGSGTRLRPITRTGPKQLIPIANRPVILYCLDDILDCGITDIGIILGENYPQKIIDLIGDGKQYGAKITYILQGKPRGIAHAIGCARDFIGEESFVVYLGDNLLKSGISEISSDFADDASDGLILLCRVEEPSRFGVAELDESGNILDLREKPSEPVSDLALVGVYFLTPSVFPMIDSLEPSKRGELEITDAIRKMMESGYRIKARTVTGWWKDTGRVEDILESNRLLLADSISGASGNGTPTIGRDVRIDGSVKLIPPLVIGDRCSISGGSVIGPFVSVGDDCRIRGANVEDSVLDIGVRIDCRRTIRSSLLGKGVIIVETGRSDGGLERPVLTLVLGENSYVEL